METDAMNLGSTACGMGLDWECRGPPVAGLGARYGAPRPSPLRWRPD